jgi:exodeoxyribonuclease VII large subunit
MIHSRYTLLELNSLIRDVLQDNLPEVYWIIAEISEMKVNRTGHCYLELVEKEPATDEIVARARATIWSYTFRMVKPYFETATGQPFREGIKVMIQVSVEFHPAYGLSLNIRDIDPAYTLGDMVRRRREIIARLQEAGVFDMNRELPLPLVPQRIAVISSSTAAGYGDFIHQLENNSHGFLFATRLYEAYMQGNEAVPSILNSLDSIFTEENEFDAVAIIRGGGAQADLNCFDSYDLAYAVTQFPLPVITGIGHEKDDTILDLVAHTRLKTPTAVAEFFISGMAKFEERLNELKLDFTDRVHEIIESRKEEMDDLSEELYKQTIKYLSGIQIKLGRLGQRYKNGVNSFVNRNNVTLFRYQSRMIRLPALMVHKMRHELSGLVHKTRLHFKSRLQAETIQLHQLDREIPQKFRSQIMNALKMNQRLEESVRMLDPKNILRRGFTFTLQRGKILKSFHEVSEIEDIETRFHDGAVISKIQKKLS